jgi:hypothetical protein
MTITSYLTKLLGKHKRSGRKEQHSFCCPACRYGSNFEVNLDDPKHPLMHCWYCDVSFRSWHKFFLKFWDNDRYRDFVSQTGIKDEVVKDKSESKLPEIIRLPEDFRFVLDVKDIESMNGRYYARHIRQLSDEIIKKLDIGISSEPKFKNRIIIPSVDKKEKLNYFIARAIDDRQPKYLNAEAEKTKIIFNERYIDYNRPLMIVEGIFDAAKAMHVYDNVVPLLGSSFNEKFILFENVVKNKTPLILSLDNNVKMKKVKILKTLLYNGIEVEVTPLTLDEDLGSSNIKDIEKIFEQRFKIEGALDILRFSLNDESGPV